MITLFRVVIQVGDITAASYFYSTLLALEGERVSPGRHYFTCGQAILACYDPIADGDGRPAVPASDHLYFATTDLEGAFQRARRLDCRALDDTIEARPWGERSFYLQDPFGNPICVVDAATAFRGTRPADATHVSEAR